MEVTKKDLKGDIKDFPLEVVQAMVNEQVRQFNKADVKVFQNNNEETRHYNGFTWSISKEGYKFWDKVIRNKKFSVFFKRYPKKHNIKYIIISEYDYKEYQELKRNSVKHRIDGCLMEDCNDLNYDHPGDISDYHSYELISKGYGDKDVFKAKYPNGDDIILFGEWVD